MWPSIDFIFLLTLLWPVRIQPVNVACGAVFTSWLQLHM